MQPVRGVLRTLILLTSVLIFVQLLFVGIHQYVIGMGEIQRIAIVQNIHLLLRPLALFLLAQFILYALYIYLMWYLTVAVVTVFSIHERFNKLTAAIIFTVTTYALLAAHTYLVPHSFFTRLILENLPSFIADDRAVYFAFASSLVFITTLLLIAIIQSVRMCIRKQQHVKYHLSALVLIAVIASSFLNLTTANHQKVLSAHQPNVFIIGFDALRPDYLSYFNPNADKTTMFDRFLESAVVFDKTYTPLARTLPSWTSILTAKYPLHHHAREDNTSVNLIDLDETLPKKLRNAGYETIYVSDDNRFGYINSQFGFDRIIGSDGNIVDFMMSAINDYPLSNLVIPTPAGRLLFPYNHGNHGYAAAYHADNFLDTIHRDLQSPSTKPLMMAVHFNVTAFPFYRFNDHQSFKARPIVLYKNSIQDADALLTSFLDELKQHGLLQNAVVFLISDHGISLGQPNDRITSEQLYEGNKNDILLKRSKYATFKATKDNINLLMNKENYGYDTSYGYGSDVLSLTQTSPLLAVKIYGKNDLSPHRVVHAVSLLDITPTILDILNLSALQTADGTSLAADLNQSSPLFKSKPFFFESGFSVPEIESEGIIVDKVVVRNYMLFEVNPESGLVTMKPDAIDMIKSKKQRAVMMDDWFFAYYPESVRYKEIINHQTRTIKYEQYIAPAYRVLVNLKTKAWTVDFNSQFAKAAPVDALTKELKQFYATEMDFYH